MRIEIKLVDSNHCKIYRRRFLFFKELVAEVERLNKSLVCFHPVIEGPRILDASEYLTQSALFYMNRMD